MTPTRYIILFFFFAFFSNAQNYENKIEQKLYLYGSEGCHTCTETKKFLEKNKIKYTFYDVDNNIEKQKEMIDYLRKSNISLKNLNLPAVRMGNQIITNEPTFEEFLQNILKLIKK